MNESPAVDRLTDEDLVRRAAAGDRNAFAALYRRRRPDVFRFALHMTAETSVAEDIVQDVFMVVIDDAARFEPGRATVAAWLCGIARNRLRQRLERDRRAVGGWRGTEAMAARTSHPPRRPRRQPRCRARRWSRQ